MKVSVYKNDDGSMSVLAEPSPGKGRPPVLLQGVTAATVRAQLPEMIRQMRRPKGAPLLGPR